MNYKLKDLIYDLLKAKSYDKIKEIIKHAENSSTYYKKINAICLHLIDTRRMYLQEGYNSFTSFVMSELDLNHETASFYKRIGAVILEGIKDLRDESDRKWTYQELEPFLTDTSFEIGKLHYLPEAFENHLDRQKVFDALMTMSYREFKAFAMTNSLLPIINSLPKNIETSLYQTFHEELISNEEAQSLLEKAYDQDEDASTYHLNDTLLDPREAALLTTGLSKTKAITSPAKANIPRQLSSGIFHTALQNCNEDEEGLLRQAYEYVEEIAAYRYNILSTPKMAATISRVLAETGYKNKPLYQLSEIFSEKCSISRQYSKLCNNRTSFPNTIASQTGLEGIFQR